jgi:hypothetical protein
MKTIAIIFPRKGSDYQPNFCAEERFTNVRVVFQPPPDFADRLAGLARLLSTQKENSYKVSVASLMDNREPLAATQRRVSVPPGLRGGGSRPAPQSLPLLELYRRRHRHSPDYKGWRGASTPMASTYFCAWFRASGHHYREWSRLPRFCRAKSVGEYARRSRVCIKLAWKAGNSAGCAGHHNERTSDKEHCLTGHVRCRTLPLIQS